MQVWQSLTMIYGPISCSQILEADKFTDKLLKKIVKSLWFQHILSYRLMQSLWMQSMLDMHAHRHACAPLYITTRYSRWAIFFPPSQCSQWQHISGLKFALASSEAQSSHARLTHEFLDPPSTEILFKKTGTS